MAIARDITDLIGATPLLELSRFSVRYDVKATLLAKLEGMNPAGSAKDRVAASMIAAAEATGDLHPGATIIEPTSGNTGIGLAAVAAVKGYKVILTMPDTMSEERRRLLRAYGAELVLTDGKLGMTGAISKAKELAASIPNSFIPGQFDNPANPNAHYRATGPEIWTDTEGKVDAIVAGIGTGGTITGVGRYLKECNSTVQVIGAEPAASAVLTGGRAGAHGLQGIGAGFVPAILDRSVVDEVLTVEEKEAYEAARILAKSEGVLVGISSGAALVAAVRWASRPENADKRVVVLLPDVGDRYLSTSLFE